MSLLELSTLPDVFYQILNHSKYSILKLRLVSTYFNKYIDSYTNTILQNKSIQLSINLNKYTLTNINHDKLIHLTKILIAIKYPNETDTKILTFIFNHITLKLVKHINNITYDEKSGFDLDPPKHVKMYYKICYHIKENYNLLNDCNCSIAKLACKLQCTKILEMRNINNKIILNFFDNIFCSLHICKNGNITPMGSVYVNNFLNDNKYKGYFSEKILKVIKKWASVKYTMNFAFHPEDLRPSGSCNFSNLLDRRDFLVALNEHTITITNPLKP
jgi:hypothetical protein